MEKTKVIETLAGDASPKEQFNTLLHQLLKHPHHPPGVVRFLNASGYTAPNLATLKYDVKKTYGITDAEIRAFEPEQEVIQMHAVNHSQQELDAQKEAVIQNLLSLDIDTLDYHKELKPAAIGLASNLGKELPDFKTETLKDFLNEQKALFMEVKEAEEVKNEYETATDEAKDGLKFRSEFPFLSEEGTPDKLKILVADKFTALENFEAAHEQIQKMRAEGQTDGLFSMGKKAVENWEMNQLIYDELNHYLEHKEILGNHPIFEEEMRQKLVDAYSTQEAMKRQGNLRSYISRDTKKLEKMTDAEKKATAEVKIKEWQDELNLIDARLNADQAKK